jgi:hypothetical protein
MTSYQLNCPVELTSGASCLLVSCFSDVRTRKHLLYSASQIIVPLLLRFPTLFMSRHMDANYTENKFDFVIYVAIHTLGVAPLLRYVRGSATVPFFIYAGPQILIGVTLCVCVCVCVYYHSSKNYNLTTSDFSVLF